ncbi:hypothetical protein V491_02657, partial [Pseudogymnoascus sp. VKM F-3775]
RPFSSLSSVAVVIAVVVAVAIAVVARPPPFFFAPQCDPEENPAEYMLTMVGAGASGRATQDWHEVWKSSEECVSVQRELAPSVIERVTVNMQQSSRAIKRQTPSRRT